MPPLQTMDDMQCMWFQKELARAYWRSGQYGESLVKYHEIDKVYERERRVLKWPIILVDFTGIFFFIFNSILMIL